MGKNEACVEVFCDKPGCDEMERVPLTALAGDCCWDERNVDKELLKYGWNIRTNGFGEDEYTCPGCVEEEEYEEAEGDACPGCGIRGEVLCMLCDLCEDSCCVCEEENESS